MALHPLFAEICAAHGLPLERDTDPDLVARADGGRAAWATRIGHPKRCQTNQVHPGLGCCLFCGADSGENCRAEQRA